MGLRFLLDEDTERDLAQKLRHAGHDVERVVEADELGTGATDGEVRAYARRTDRILVTHDDDHVSVLPDEHAGVFYGPNQRLSSFTLFQIIQQIANQHRSPDEMAPVVYLTEKWIQ